MALRIDIDDPVRDIGEQILERLQRLGALTFCALTRRLILHQQRKPLKRPALAMLRPPLRMHFDNRFVLTQQSHVQLELRGHPGQGAVIRLSRHTAIVRMDDVQPQHAREFGQRVARNLRKACVVFVLHLTRRGDADANEIGVEHVTEKSLFLDQTLLPCDHLTDLFLGPDLLTDII